SAVLSDANAATATFIAPDVLADEQLVFEVAVSDGQDTSTARVTVEVVFINQMPQLSWVTTERAFDEESSFTLEMSAIDNDNQNLSYAWSQLSGEALSFDTRNESSISVQAPSVSADSQVVMRVTVSDGVDSVSLDIALTVNDVTAPAPPPPDSSGDSGGGTMGWYMLCLLSLALMRRASVVRRDSIYR
ncbi:MAG: GlyGly-CTERM sorting domain-containing protein, partial [Pseudomonadota bacterium]